MTNAQKKAMDAVFKELDKLSPEELMDLCEKHKDGDIALALKELSEFSKYLETKMTDRELEER